MKEQHELHVIGWSALAIFFAAVSVPLWGIAHDVFNPVVVLWLAWVGFLISATAALIGLATAWNIFWHTRGQRQATGEILDNKSEQEFLRTIREARAARVSPAGLLKVRYGWDDDDIDLLELALNDDLNDDGRVGGEAKTRERIVTIRDRANWAHELGYSTIVEVLQWAYERRDAGLEFGQVDGRRDCGHDEYEYALQALQLMGVVADRRKGKPGMLKPRTYEEAKKIVDTEWNAGGGYVPKEQASTENQVAG
ncbi:MAG: hypothetical protein WC869_10430 [Phycisphaerae bacterium]